MLLRAFVLALLFMIAPAFAEEDIPRGLGHPSGTEHWYDNSCCSKRDCERVEPGAIRETDDGYLVRYRTSRGHVAEGFIKKNSTGVKQSQDGFEHACAPFATVNCIYLPMFT